MLHFGHTASLNRFNINQYGYIWIGRGVLRTVYRQKCCHNKRTYTSNKSVGAPVLHAIRTRFVNYNTCSSQPYITGWGVGARFNSICIGLIHIMVYFPIDSHRLSTRLCEKKGFFKRFDFQKKRFLQQKKRFSVPNG